MKRFAAGVILFSFIIVFCSVTLFVFDRRADSLIGAFLSLAENSGSLGREELETESKKLTEEFESFRRFAALLTQSEKLGAAGQEADELVWLAEQGDAGQLSIACKKAAKELQRLRKSEKPLPENIF